MKTFEERCRNRGLVLAFLKANRHDFIEFCEEKEWDPGFYNICHHEWKISKKWVTLPGMQRKRLTYLECTLCKTSTPI